MFLSLTVIVARIERQRNPGTMMQAARLPRMSLTLHAGYRLSRAALLRFDAGRLDHLRPFGAVASQRRGGLLWRGGSRLEAERVKALFHVGQCDGFADLAMEQCDDVSPRAGRGEHADPEIAFDFREPRFRHGRNVR